MSGTVAGGKTAAVSNKAIYGQDFYARIGSIGGRNGHSGGFAAMTPERRSECGRKGGTRSRRLPRYRVMFNGEVMSQGEVAERIGITKQWVSQLLRQKDNKYNMYRVGIDN